MSDFQISDYLLNKECEEIAQEIFDESDDKDESEMSDRIRETIDGHQWVIYNYKALMICAHCNVNQGEEFLDDIGMPADPTIYSIASMIVYGEMIARTEEHLRDLVAAHEESEEEESEESAD